MAEMKIQNKLRTPPQSPKNKLYSDESCKIHLAEIYTLNKQVDKLNQEFESKTKSEKLLDINLKIIEKNSDEKIKELLIEIDEQKSTIDKLMNKLKIVESSHSHQDLIEFYEKEIESIQLKNNKYLKMFNDMLKVISPFPNNINNKDDIWRNLIKRLENKITDLEIELSEYRKKERKIINRQKFFEKYCVKAEERIEEVTKISKKFYDRENLVNQLKSDLEKCQSELQEKRKLSKEQELSNATLVKENEEYKSFVDKIKPILKLDWSEIKNSNEENFIQISEKDKQDINSKNIITLLDNMSSYVKLIQEKSKNKETNILHTTENIKNYIFMLLKKIQLMDINQYHIINTCCDINERMVLWAKKNKVGLDFMPLLKDIKHSCSKLLFDFNPK